MSMTPEEIDRIYIQEHGMTKGAFSVGLQGSLMHRNSVEKWAEGDPVKVWLEGKDVGEKSTVCIAYERQRQAWTKSREQRNTRGSAPRGRRSRHRSKRTRIGHCKPQKAKFAAKWNENRQPPGSWQR